MFLSKYDHLNDDRQFKNIYFYWMKSNEKSNDNLYENCTGYLLYFRFIWTSIWLSKILNNEFGTFQNLMIY